MCLAYLSVSIPKEIPYLSVSIPKEIPTVRKKKYWPAKEHLHQTLNSHSHVKKIIPDMEGGGGRQAPKLWHHFFPTS
jgi:hypothetical protein